MAVKQTAGRDILGEFAPKFAALNDDVLFGEVWSREEQLSLSDRSLVTVVALIAQGLTDTSFRYHLESAKRNGITRTEIAEILTHVAFYAGWPKAWAAFRMAKEVWGEETSDADEAMARHARQMVFPIGAPNDAYAQYFSGRSYLAPLSTTQIGIHNVTFEPGCRNHWHIHHAECGERRRSRACQRTPQSLAYPSCGVRRRADSRLRRGARLLSGGGGGCAGTPAGRRCQHPAEREALARRGKGQLVFASRDRSPGRAHEQRVVRFGIR